MDPTYGLYGIGDVEHGTHLCCLYGSEEEHRALLTPFLRRGLERGEKVLYVRDSNATGTLLEYLLSDGLATEPCLLRGQLEFLDSRDAFLRDGVFDPRRMVALLRAAIEDALEDGYPGVRVTCEMTWALSHEAGSGRLAEFEANLNALFPVRRAIILCQYDTRSFPPEMLLDALEAHPVVAPGNDLCDNFYYVPPEACSGPERFERSLGRKMRNLKERGKLEAALKRGEERYRILFQRSPVGIFHYDDRLHITECNDRFVEILQSPREVMVGLDMNLLKDKTIHPALHAPLEGRVGLYEGYYHATLSPAVIFVSLRTVPYFGEDGKIRGGIGIVDDITERKEIEKEQQIFMSLVENSTDLIGIASLDGKVFYLNGSGRKLSGLEELETAVKTRIQDYSLEEDVPTLQKMVGSLQKKGTWKGEARIRHFKTGLPVPVDVHAFLIRDAKTGQPIAVAAIGRDISVRKKMEAEMARSEKLDSIGVLAGGIAHDFNNLLTAIFGNITLAKMYANREGEVYKRLEESEKAALRAKDLTQQLLTYSRGGAPVKKSISIREMVMESAGFALRGSNIKCEFSFPDDLWPVEADEGQLSQAVNNLIINAAHAMPEGGAVQVYCRNVSGDRNGLPPAKGNHVSISIMDHGIGIPKEHLSKIFDPYFTTKRKGSGLGLSTTYSIVKNHGGHLAVESELGIGTTFHIYLPAAAGGNLSSKPEEGPSVSGRGRILVMDDEEAVRDVAREMLESFGYSVTLASDGAEAVAIYRQAMASGEPLDSVLMDLTIPGGMGGQEAITKLLEIDPGVKAIVCSGYSNDPVMSSYRAYGFRGVIRKPYSLKQLSDTIFDVLSISA